MNKENPKIIFFGTPDFAAGILKALLTNRYNVAAVFTQPDKKIGRKQKIAHSAVKKLALENKIKVFQPESLRDDDLAREIVELKPDLFVVAAYGKILPKAMLGIPKYGAINVHASLLPKYRGASPVQCAILSGEKETGVTLMRMNEKMDEGDILRQEKIEISKNETTDSLMEKSSRLGAKMVIKFVPDWIQGKIEPTHQDHSLATYCKPVKREDGKIDWSSAAREIHRKWRAYLPWPGIFSMLSIKNQPRRLRLLEIGIDASAETGEKAGKVLKYNESIAVQSKKGLIILKKVQLEGKKEMDVDEFARGCPEFIGRSLV